MLTTWLYCKIATVAIPYMERINLTSRGLLLAALSGAVASGIGYTAWYAALKFHTPTRAAILQLSVPVLAAAIGILFMSEAATSRLLLAAALILGGIALAIFGKRR